MSMQAAFAKLTDRVYARLGEAATYAQKAPGTATASVTVLVERNLTQYGSLIQMQDRAAVISVRVSELAQCPRRGDTITLTGGTVYGVEAQITSDHGQEWKFTAVQR